VNRSSASGPAFFGRAVFWSPVLLPRRRSQTPGPALHMHASTRRRCYGKRRREGPTSRTSVYLARCSLFFSLRSLPLSLRRAGLNSGSEGKDTAGGRRSTFPCLTSFCLRTEIYTVEKVLVSPLVVGSEEALPILLQLLCGTTQDRAIVNALVSMFVFHYSLCFTF
jgi:hypothetical protein